MVTNLLILYGKMKKQKIILVQLGSPKTPSTKDVRAFLKEFLGDPRVLDISPILRKIILNLFILPFRPKQSAKLYRRIWDGKTFPLIENTEKLSQRLADKFVGDNIEVEHVFLLSDPRFRDVWDKWEKEDVNTRAQKWLIVPLFPQYSAATTASVMDMFFNELKKRTQIPSFEFINDFYNSAAFIDPNKKIIKANMGTAKDLVVSFHGLPKRRIIENKDPYYTQCFSTYKLISEDLKGVVSHLSFQSRFGREEWLTPSTEDCVLELIDQGKKDIAICCPSFVSDCLETTDEIGHELKKLAKEKGANLTVIPCVNYEESWVEGFYDLLKAKIQGTKPKVYELSKEEMMSIPEQKLTSTPLSPMAKKSLKIVFLTLFLDLVGFSIIFPLFPAMAKWYMEVDSGNYFLNLIFSGINSMVAQESNQIFNSLVLFGGLLGALYSFLQFLAAPFWGSLSDKIGRKPVLVVSISFLALSYLIWFFSGSFTLLILSRFLAGIMGGNISTATAVAADVTDNNNRSKGMAIIGIAFALGFILGPAIGGIFSTIDLTKMYPSLVAWGVNPFSVPALVAFLLSVLNTYLVVKNFKETLPEDKREVHTERTSNIKELFKPLPYKGVNLTNLTNFLFISIFSGMEFTLTFLAFERLGYGPLDNAYLFVFIGVILALVQGGYVRRKAHSVGEKKLVLRGLFLIIPGLIAIAFTKSPLLLYVGLFFLAVGSAIIIPCLTALVSLYTPHENQGKSIGIFRSLGALGRVVGPIFASLIYWKWGSAVPYFLGSALLSIPILMVWFLPPVAKKVSA